MADLLVVTGPPGAGKSTVAARVVDAFDSAALVPGDAFFGYRLRGAIAPWLPAAHEQNVVALRAAAAAAATFAAAGCTVVYDGVVGPWSLPLFAREAAGRGLDVTTELHYVVLLPSLQRCLERVAARRGHGFTDASATARMHEQFVAADVGPGHVVLDPPDAAEEVAALVLARRAAGRLRYRG